MRRSLIPDVQTASLPPMPAFDQAWQTFRAGGVRDFAADVIDHLRNGVVVATPGMFVMAKAVQLPDGRRAWDVHHAAGPLVRLLAAMPFHLDWICFERRNDRRQRIYSTARMQQLALARHNKQTVLIA